MGIGWVFQVVRFKHGCVVCCTLRSKVSPAEVYSDIVVYVIINTLHVSVMVFFSCCCVDI